MSSAPFFNPILGSKERPRILKACDRCRKRKIRCDGKLPCMNCSSVELCTFSPHRERRRRKKTGSNDSTNSLSIAALNELQSMAETSATTTTNNSNNSSNNNGNNVSKPRGNLVNRSTGQREYSNYEKSLLNRVESLELLIKNLSGNMNNYGQLGSNFSGFRGGFGGSVSNTFDELNSIAQASFRVDEAASQPIVYSAESSHITPPDDMDKDHGFNANYSNMIGENNSNVTNNINNFSSNNDVDIDNIENSDDEPYDDELINLSSINKNNNNNDTSDTNDTITNNDFDDMNKKEVESVNDKSQGSLMSMISFKKYSGLLTRQLMRPDLRTNPRKNKCNSIFGYLTQVAKDWIKRKIHFRDLGLYWSMERLPSLFQSPQLSLIRSWLEAPSKTIANLSNLLNEGKFPTDENLVFGLLNTFYSKVFFANFVCEVESIIQLFTLYYRNLKNSTIKTELTSSELLIMNIALAIALENKDNEWCKATELYYPEDLREMQGQWFHNSVHYYQQVHLVSDGLSTVQAILLLTLYVNSRYTTDFHVNAMLMLTTIRFALELGINRSDLVNAVSDEEADLSRRVWWFCQLLDIDSSYKTGKPPNIHQLDTSTLTEIDVECPYAIGEDLAYNFGYVTMKAAENGAYIYYCYALLALTRIKYHSYYLLFSAKAQATTGKSMERTYELLELINQMMFDFVMALDPLIRPDYVETTMAQMKGNLITPQVTSDPIFAEMYKNNEDFMYEAKMIIQDTFYLHLMVINKMPFAVYFPDALIDEKYSNLSYQASKALVRGIVDMDRSRLNKFTTTNMMNSAFIAFVTVIFIHISKQDSSGLKEDFDLLSKVSMDVFSAGFEYYTTEDWKRERQNDPKSVMSILVVRVMIRILVGVVETDSGYNLASSNPKLQKHLDGCEEIYQEIFENASKAAISDFFFMNLNIPNCWTEEQPPVNNMGKSTSRYSTSRKSTNSGASENYDPNRVVPENVIDTDHSLTENHTNVNTNFNSSSSSSSNISPITNPLSNADVNTNFSTSRQNIDSQPGMISYVSTNYATTIKQEDRDIGLQDYNDDAISSLLYSQAYNLSGSIFQEAYKSR